MQMKIAIVTDIHGNSDALNAILLDLKKNGPFDHTIVLGDHVAGGPDPCDVVKKLQSIKNNNCIMGNTDRWVFSGDTPLPPKNKWDIMGLSKANQRARACGWTAGLLMNEDKLDWITKLPFKYELILPNKKKVLFVHANPKNDEEGFGENTPIKKQKELLVDCDADVIITGHVHSYYTNKIFGKTIYTIPSVSLPTGKDKSAAYAIFKVHKEKTELLVKRIEYDYKKMILKVIKQKHPSVESITEYYK